MNVGIRVVRELIRVRVVRDGVTVVRVRVRIN